MVTTLYGIEIRPLFSIPLLPNIENSGMFMACVFCSEELATRAMLQIQQMFIDRKLSIVCRVKPISYVFSLKSPGVP